MALGQRRYIWFRISGRTIHPHRLYLPRGGRQVGCITCGVEMVSPDTRYPHCSGGNLPPTGPEGRSRGTFVSATAKPETPVIPTAAQAEWRNPPRGRKYQRKVKSATGKIPRLRFTTLGMTYRGGWSRLTKRVIFATVPAPRRGWMALGQRRYICTVYWVLPFTRTGYICYVAGGRLPPLRYICYELPCFQRVYHCFAFIKCEKRGALT